MIYLDNAATTRMSDGVVNAMMPYMTTFYGNPSSLHQCGAEARDAVEHSREIIADFIGAKPEQIYFTSGGSEANNWVLQDYTHSIFNGIITSKLEHHSVLKACDAYAVGVSENGVVDLQWLEDAIRYCTGLISVMFANNEIGTIQPIKEIGEIARRHKVAFHTDAVQAFGHIPINVNELQIDYLSASAHKLGGPKGIGFLYCRNGDLSPMIRGGSQERGLRAGTENVPAIVGFGKAVEEAARHMKDRAHGQQVMRDHMIKRVLAEIPGSRLNGDTERRLPNNANFSFTGVNGEDLVIALDEQGICCSSGSACNEGDHQVSHVLKAIGVPEEYIKGSVRFTLGNDTIIEDIDYTVDVLKNTVEVLRE